MTAGRAPAGAPSLAVFDLDGTLTRADTLAPYLAGFLRRNPRRLRGVWRLVPALLDYTLRSRDRGLLKSRVIRAVMAGERRSTIEAWTREFVQGLEPGGRFHAAALATLAAHRAAGDHLVLLSASPDLYVPAIGRRLGFERTLCTELSWRGDRLEGELATPNRRGEEKRRCLEWLRTQYPDAPVVAYGNAGSDLDHMRCADRAVLVNAGGALRKRAMSLGIALTDWQ